VPITNSNQETGRIAVDGVHYNVSGLNLQIRFDIMLCGYCPIHNARHANQKLFIFKCRLQLNLKLMVRGLRPP